VLGFATEGGGQRPMREGGRSDWGAGIIDAVGERGDATVEQPKVVKENMRIPEVGGRY